MQNILDYLEETVLTINPNKPAFISAQTTMSFSDLYKSSKAIGSFISSHKFKNKPIIVFMEKSPEMISAFFGVVYSGNLYVPLDKEMPKIRIQMVLDIIKPEMILYDSVSLPFIETLNINAIKADYSDVSKTITNHTSLSKIRASVIDTDPVYVVFTSGSTGVPKGVIANHRNIIDYIENLSNILEFNENTIFGNQAPLFLDACLKEIVPVIKFGATAYLIPKQLFMFPVKLLEYINQNKINTICWVSSVLSFTAEIGALETTAPTTLKTVAFGGEVLSVSSLNRWIKALPNTSFTQLYGPTEATGMSAYYKIPGSMDESKKIPIGKPFPNTEIFLLKENESASEGEICIRGTCLSPGYYGDATRTAESFVQNPLTDFPDIIYKTGDIGCLNSNEELYFVSRKDFQIKHMGHRVELSEIELSVVKFEGIQLAAAIYDKNKSRIILFYSSNKGIDEKALKAVLKQNLPKYMLPYSIHGLETMPLTLGGKINRKEIEEIYYERFT